MSYTNADQFLPSGATLVLPNGKTIFVADVGHYKTVLTAKQNVLFQGTTATGVKTDTYLIPAGGKTPPIGNSYYSKSTGQVIVEFDRGVSTYRAPLTRANFDVAALNALPSTEAQKAEAEKKSEEANVAHAEQEAWDSAADLFGNAKKLALVGGVGFVIFKLWGAYREARKK